MAVNFAYTILYVPDVEKTLSFYNKAFGFEIKFMTPEKDYGELITGNTCIAFANIELGNSNFKDGFKTSTTEQKPFGIELAFTTDDVEGLMNTAAVHGATVLSPMVKKPWGQDVGYLRDINGFLVEICTVVQAGS